MAESNPATADSTAGPTVGPAAGPTAGPTAETGGRSADTEPAHPWRRTDNRWRHYGTRRSWMILAAMVACYLAWTLTIVILEPGIR